METSKNEIRKHQRFAHDVGTLVEVDLDLNNENFSPTLWGLVINDSFGGCAMIIVTNEILGTNQNCAVKFPTLKPFPGKIVWVKALDANVLKIGIEYID
jgi:hypothetical protein